MLYLSVTINFNNFNVQSSKCFDKSLKCTCVSLSSSFKSLSFLGNFIFKFREILFLFCRRIPLLSCLLCCYSLLFELFHFLCSYLLNFFLKFFLNLFLIKISCQPFIFFCLKNINNFR